MAAQRARAEAVAQRARAESVAQRARAETATRPQAPPCATAKSGASAAPSDTNRKEVERTAQGEQAHLGRARPRENLLQRLARGLAHIHRLQAPHTPTRHVTR